MESIKNLIEGWEQYTAHNKKICYKTFGNLDYYFLKCNQLGVKPHAIDSGLSYEASNDLIEFDYCEHDIILHVKNIYVRSPFSGWHKATKQQAKKWAHSVVNGANFKENAREIVKKSILGIKFEELGV